MSMAGELGSGEAGIVTMLPVPADCLTMLGMPVLLQQLHHVLAKPHRDQRSSNEEFLVPTTGSQAHSSSSTVNNKMYGKRETELAKMWYKKV